MELTPKNTIYYEKNNTGKCCLVNMSDNRSSHG